MSTGDIFAYAVPAIVLICTIFGIMGIRSALSGSNWSVADALSEDVKLTAMNSNNEPIMENGAPFKVTVLRASSSRLIALLGLVAIMAIFVGFALIILRDYSKTGSTPVDITNVLQFLLGGMTMFAPYAVNKFSSIFDWIKPGGS